MVSVEVSLSDYTTSGHWLCLAFIPAAFSFICPTELLAFSAHHSEFLYHSACAVAFISTDSEYCLRAWNATPVSADGLGGIHLPLLSDRSHFVSSSYGVLDEEEGFARRALFLIDPKGMIRYSVVSDKSVGRSVDETKRVLDALQYTDEFGEGCPSDWRKGQEGLKMDKWDYVPSENAPPLLPPRGAMGKVGNVAREIVGALSPITTRGGSGGTLSPKAKDEGNISPHGTVKTSTSRGGPGHQDHTAEEQKKRNEQPKRPSTLRRLHTSPSASREEDTFPTIRNLDQQVLMHSMDEVTPPPPERQLQMRMEKDRERRQSIDCGGGGGGSGPGNITGESGSARSSWASVLSPASMVGRRFSIISQTSGKSGYGGGQGSEIGSGVGMGTRAWERRRSIAVDG